MMRVARAGLVACALAAATGSAVAHADPVVLRVATMAPEGTAWAREVRAFGREVGTTTHDSVQFKWYFSGIAGDELRSHERVQRDQLDAILSGGMLCQKLSPSMRSTGMVGEFRDRDEARYVVARLRPALDAELLKVGYVNLITAGLGFSVIFSRTPVRTMDDLRKLRPWLWDLDEVRRTQLAAMGVPVVRLPVEGSARAYDQGKIDGWVGLPSAALAFQWSTQARYVTDLRVGFLTACVLVARRAWDTLSHEQQQAVLAAAAKLQRRVEDAARHNDEMLLGGLFARQGLQATPVAAALQSEFSSAAKEARKSVEPLIAPEMIDRVSGWIAEYRSNTRRGEKR
jgi:TRAP-type C4-dicarboxylate transport system substrate-binding protein